MFVSNVHIISISRILLIEDIHNWYSTATHYAKCDKTKNSNWNISSLVLQFRTCITVLNTLSRHAIKSLCHRHFNVSKCLISIGCRLTTKQELKCSSVICQAKVVHEGIYNKVRIE